MFFAILLIGLVSADFWACFNKGEIIDFCSEKIDDRTCGSSVCQVCIKEYNETENCYSPGNINKCNKAKGSCFQQGNASIDGNGPELVINNPLEDGFYMTKSVLVDFDLNERSSVYYYDNIYGRRWTRICSRCNAGTPAYSRKRSFKEGFNNITFKAIDVIGNEAYETITFLVDSKKTKNTQDTAKKRLCRWFI